MATLAKVRLMTNESDDRSPLGLPFESGLSHLCINCKVEKERLSPTTPASVMITLALIGAWHNSLDRMPAVILVSPLLNYFIFRLQGKKQKETDTQKEWFHDSSE